MLLSRAASRLRYAAAPAALVASAGVVLRRFASTEPGAAEPGLSPDKFTPLTLKTVTKLTENTAIYRFAFKDGEAPSGVSFSCSRIQSTACLTPSHTTAAPLVSSFSTFVKLLREAEKCGINYLLFYS